MAMTRSSSRVSTSGVQHAHQRSGPGHPHWRPL